MERNQLKTFAKKLLSKQEYLRFKTALKSFEKKGRVLDFCIDLLEMVNTPEKTEILVEARKMLPKSKQSEFSKICRDLVNERWTMSAKMSLHYGVDQCKENNDGLPSPAKRARQGDYKLLGNALKTGISDRQYPKKPLTLQQLQVDKKEKHSYERRRPPPVPYQDGNVLFTGETPTMQDILQAKEFENCKNLKVLRMERESKMVNFGFKILGDLFTEREIVVKQVDPDSIAEKSGLKQRDRITRINNIDCERARKSDIVSLIKSENKLKLTVVSDGYFKEAQDIRVKESAVALATSAVHGHDTKKVTVYADEDGWMGCSIRGGIDYDCEVHIISVADGSPAETAGIRQGDVITEVNGVSLNDCTHVQAIHLILTASPPIIFTVRHYDNRSEGGYLRVLPERQNHNNLPHTPLRISTQRPRRLQQHASDMVPYHSPLPPPPSPPLQQHASNMVLYHSPLPPPPPPLQQHASDMVLYHSPLPLPPPPLPGYWYQNDNPSVGASGVVGSPSALPFSTLHLDGTPPPPYTAELPQMHRVIQMGGNVRENRNNGNHGLLLPMETDMPSQYNRSSMLQNENPERNAVQLSTHKDTVSSNVSASCSLNVETASIGNSQIVLPNDGINDTSGFNAEKDEANVKPKGQSCLLEAIKNFNPGLLKTAKARIGSHTPGELLLSSGANDSLEADVEPVRGNESSVSAENQDIESSEADFRTIINQALMKRRADILDSSQESVNESYCSEWDL